MLEAQIEARFAKRVRAFVEPLQARFWDTFHQQGWSADEVPDEVFGELMQLERDFREARARAAAAAGWEAADQQAARRIQSDPTEQMLGFLPPERRAAVEAMAKRTPGFANWLWERGGTSPLYKPEIRAARADRAKGVLAELAPLLTTSELEELELRRFALQCYQQFDRSGTITEDQQRAVIVSQREYRQTVDSLMTTGAVRRAAVLEAKARLEADRLRILGESATLAQPGTR